MTELELMQSIKEDYGMAIENICHTSSLPPAFLAALIANESGGDPNAKRFEPHVLAALWEVLLGRTANYGSIGGQDLLQYICKLTETPPRVPQSLPTDAFSRLDALATSWGLTQILGYEIFAFSTLIPDVGKLQTTQGNLGTAVMMLAQFAERWQLDLATDFQQLFDAWNTGRPHAQTADPEYIPNGLVRMAIYEGLA